MPSTQRSFVLLNRHILCATFIHNRTQCIDAFSPLLQKYRCKEPRNSQNFLCNRKNAVKCSASVVSQKRAIECGIAFSEMRLFFESHVLEFHEIWHEDTLGNKC